MNPVPSTYAIESATRNSNFALQPTSSQDEEAQTQWAIKLSMRGRNVPDVAPAHDEAVDIVIDPQSLAPSASHESALLPPPPPPMSLDDNAREIIVPNAHIPVAQAPVFDVQQGMPPPIVAAAAPQTSYYSFTAPQSVDEPAAPLFEHEIRDPNAPLYADLEAERVNEVRQTQAAFGALGLENFLTPRKHTVLTARVDALETTTGWFGQECKLHRFHVELETGFQLERNPVVAAEQTDVTIATSPVDQYAVLRLCHTSSTLMVVAETRLDTSLLRINEDALIRLEVNKNRVKFITVRIRLEERDAPYLLRVHKRSQFPMTCDLFDAHTNEHLFVYDGGLLSVATQELRAAGTNEVLATTRAGTTLKSVYAPPMHAVHDEVHSKAASQQPTMTTTTNSLERAVDKYIVHGNRAHTLLKEAVRKPDSKNWTAPQKIGSISKGNGRLYECRDVNARLLQAPTDRCVAFKEAKFASGQAFLSIPRGVDPRLSIMAAMVGGQSFGVNVTEHMLRMPRSMQKPRPRLAPFRLASLTRVPL